MQSNRNYKTKKNKKNLKIIGFSLASAVILLASMAVVHIFNLVKDVNPDSGFDSTNENETYTDDQADFSAINDVTDATSLDNLLYQWANNQGEKLSSKNIINVMLFGVDSTNGKMVGARSDTMILVSLNKNTQKITLVSFMRDSYTYMNINGKDRYFKINASFNWGGPAATVKTVEDDYKIKIDKYVCVDFSTFPKIIDALGGVTVEVKPYEANFIRRTTHFKNFPVISKPTNLKLTGDVALVFSRIRHSDGDGDVSRTRRQRQVIMAMIKSAKGATYGQVELALGKFIFPNIRTNYSKIEILSLASQGIVHKWMDYDMEQILTPDESNREGTTIKYNDVWVVDYPLEAHKIQLALYGKSNIVIDANRKSALDMVKLKTESGS